MSRGDLPSRVLRLSGNIERRQTVSTQMNRITAETPQLVYRKCCDRMPRLTRLESQTASACRIRFVIASGCEISARWLASISIVFAPIRLAMKRSRSGLIVLSCVDTA